MKSPIVAVLFKTICKYSLLSSYQKYLSKYLQQCAKFAWRFFIFLIVVVKPSCVFDDLLLLFSYFGLTIAKLATHQCQLTIVSFHALFDLANSLTQDHVRLRYYHVRLQQSVFIGRVGRRFLGYVSSWFTSGIHRRSVKAQERLVYVAAGCNKRNVIITQNILFKPFRIKYFRSVSNLVVTSKRSRQINKIGSKVWNLWQGGFDTFFEIFHGHCTQIEQLIGYFVRSG